MRQRISKVVKKALFYCCIGVALILVWSLLPIPNSSPLSSPIDLPKTVFTVGFKGVAYASAPDYVVDGSNDDARIQTVLDSLPSTGGKIILYGCPAATPTYDFHDNVTRAINNVTIEGSGKSTSITTVGSEPPFVCTGQTGWVFKDFACDETPAGTWGVDNFRSQLWINSVLTDDLLNSKFDVAGDTLTSPIVLSGSGLIYLSFRPALDQVMIQNKVKPVMVYRGATRGFTMPIWNAGANANEQIFATEPRVPSRWDGVSDIIVIITGYLDTANDTKRFGLQVGWQSVTPGVDVVGTDINTDNTQTLTGNWAQYESFSVSVTLNYDVAPANPVLAKDCMGLRIRRIDKVGAEAEITGNVIITGIDMRYRCDKFGAST
jgi:hypothetical protein